MTTTTINPFTAENIDEILADRPFPARRPIVNGQLVRWDHARAAAWLNEIRLFWIDAAAGYANLADEGCVASIQDARDALAKAAAVTPKLAA